MRSRESAKSQLTLYSKCVSPLRAHSFMPVHFVLINSNHPGVFTMLSGDSHTKATHSRDAFCRQQHTTDLSLCQNSR